MYSYQIKQNKTHFLEDFKMEKLQVKSEAMLAINLYFGFKPEDVHLSEVKMDKSNKYFTRLYFQTNGKSYIANRKSNNWILSDV